METPTEVQLDSRVRSKFTGATGTVKTPVMHGLSGDQLPTQVRRTCSG